MAIECSFPSLNPTSISGLLWTTDTVRGRIATVDRDCRGGDLELETRPFGDGVGTTVPRWASESWPTPSVAREPLQVSGVSNPTKRLLRALRAPLPGCQVKPALGKTAWPTRGCRRRAPTSAPRQLPRWRLPGRPSRIWSGRPPHPVSLCTSPSSARPSPLNHFRPSQTVIVPIEQPVEGAVTQRVPESPRP